MFKKFVAVLGLVAILSTGTTLAADPLPGGAGAPSTGKFIKDFSISPAKINPIKNEVTKVTFTLVQNADIYSEVLSEDGKTVLAVLANFVATVAGPVTLPTWNGKEGNIATGANLADGTYSVRTYAAVKDAGGTEVVQDSILQNITVSTLNTNAPAVTGLKVSPATFSPANAEEADIYFTTNKGGFITVKVMLGLNVMREFNSFKGTFYDAGSFAITWNGKDLDNGGLVVPENKYTVQVTASLNNGADFNTVSTPVKVVKTVDSPNTGSIKNFYLDPSETWNPIKGNIDIHYQLPLDVQTVYIQAAQGNKVVKILNDKMVDSGYYTEEWDGTDDDGNYIDAGTWTVTVIANDTIRNGTVTVKYDMPAVVEAFVSKDSFDPSKNEMQNFVFKIDTKSEVTVEVFKGTTKEVKLVDEELVQKNQWYTVPWDGRDSDGAEVDYATDWKFKITAKNPTAQDLIANKNVSFKVEQDTVNDKKSNVSNDTTTPAVFDKQDSDTLEFSYNLDADPAVYMAIYEGNSTGGKAKIILMDYLKQDPGYHTVTWDGRDANGKTLKDGVYTYKMISKANGNYKDTEIGTFAIGNAGEYMSTTPQPVPQPQPQPEPTPEPEPAPMPEPEPIPYPPKPSQDCGGYIDTKYVVNQNYEMCEAIAWTTGQGIFSGYGDGSFGPNTPITRTEVLKVVLKAFPSITLLPSDGSNQGFWDADPAQWYMPYIRTAKFYNMLQGYQDGSAGVIRHVSRAEFLKFALKASSAFTGYAVPDYAFSYYADVDVNNSLQSWYRNFAGVAYENGFFGYNYNGAGAKVYLYPDKAITRGEVALVLYKMYNNYLLGYGPMRNDYGY